MEEKRGHSVLDTDSTSHRKEPTSDHLEMLLNLSNHASVNVLGRREAARKCFLCIVLPAFKGHIQLAGYRALLRVFYVLG